MWEVFGNFWKEPPTVAQSSVLLEIYSAEKLGMFPTAIFSREWKIFRCVHEEIVDKLGF